jgi:hypothetical protein
MDVRNWPVPHNARLERPVEPGQTLQIRGKTFEESEQQMVVNLATSGGGYDAPSIPLHFNVRLNDNHTILNDKNNGQWGKEEKPKMAFKAGEDFDLRIRAHNDKFEITVQGKHLCDFEYRQPLGSINHVFIDGPIMLYSVIWGGKYFPVPFQTQLSGGLGAGRKLFISGVPEKAEKFAINLLTANGDVALHFNPRFNEKKIVRNSMQNNEWQNEEREGGFPFKKDIAFDLLFVNEPYAIQIYINNEQFCSFAHRMDPNSITGLEVNGEIDLQGVHLM